MQMKGKAAEKANLLAQRAPVMKGSPRKFGQWGVLAILVVAVGVLSRRTRRHGAESASTGDALERALAQLAQCRGALQNARRTQTRMQQLAYRGLISRAGAEIALV